MSRADVKRAEASQLRKIAAMISLREDQERLLQQAEALEREADRLHSMGGDTDPDPS